MIRLLLLAVIGLGMSLCMSGAYTAQLSSFDELWAQLQKKIEPYLPSPAPAQGLRYISTGDSVPAGEDLGTNCSDSRSCEDRGQAYPSLVAELARAQYDSALSFTDVSCTGATTSNYLHDTQCGASGPQAAYFADHASWATVNVGADDLLNWITNNRRCVLDQRIADLLRTRREDCDLYGKVIAPFDANLREILVRATAAADIVVVTQYYDIFSPSFAPSVSHLPYEWTDGVNQAIDLLDGSIASVSSEFGDQVVVVDLRPVFATHEWGDSDSYITRVHRCDLVEMATPWSECWWVPGIHPNSRGQQAIADEVWAQLQRRLPLPAKQ